MGKKAAPPSPNTDTASLSQHSGLTAKGNRRSAEAKSILDSRSHRTTLGLTCADFVPFAMRSPRSAASGSNPG